MVTLESVDELVVELIKRRGAFGALGWLKVMVSNMATQEDIETDLKFIRNMEPPAGTAMGRGPAQ